MNKHRIFKNTIYLYLRMVIVIVVQLFTVRIVLKALGATDYGIYNLVGGVVVLFNFLNTTMRGATQRFINFEMGQDTAKLEETFQTSMYLHLWICIILLLVAETIGLWFVNSMLVIPADKIFDANVIYQLSIISILVSTLAVPYNAVIVAHEKMHIYAIAEVVRCVFILAGAYILYLIEYERLIVYGLIIFISTLLLNLAYAIYVHKTLGTYRLSFHPDKQLIKPMLSFSGWDLYGNFCVTARTQGINILLNMFFGVIVNAASAIATQIQGVLLTFGSNVVLAFKPQLIQQYSKQNIAEMQKLAEESTRLSMLLFGLVAIPVVIEMPYILHLWLSDVPAYTVSLTRITVLAGFFVFINSIINILIQATGDIKALSFISGSFILMALPVAYIVLKIFNTPDSAYILLMIFAAILPAISFIILKRQIPKFNIKSYLFQGFCKALLGLFCSCLLISMLVYAMDESLARLIMVCIVSLAVCGVGVIKSIGGNNKFNTLCKIRK